MDNVVPVRRQAAGGRLRAPLIGGTEVAGAFVAPQSP